MPTRTIEKRGRARLKNEVLHGFWRREFEKYPDRTDPRLYRALVAPEQIISFRRLMDEGGMLLVDLAKDLGEYSAKVLGSLLMATIGLAALSRVEAQSAARRPFVRNLPRRAALPQYTDTTRHQAVELLPYYT